ncbi:peptidoglycan bridge formation glycyltransferase FemA/FemB family protein [Streptomyces sp. NPDC002506]|uniref:lipid II:glycine glycyltransferase FemX n=1 Tax=Streptomyces sp. NPDC002506 TaxID=3154536 RepID=UPI00331ACB14
MRHLDSAVLPVRAPQRHDDGDRCAGPQLVPLDPQEHLAWAEGPGAEALGGAGFMQIPSWGRVKEGWEAQSVGWRMPQGRLVGAALVLSRTIPRLGRRFCYLPEGPVIDWRAPDLGRWLDPLVAHLRAQGAFAVRIGPPLDHRRWEAVGIRDAVRSGRARRLRDVLPDQVDPVGATVTDRLRTLGWQPADQDAQPRFAFRLPLAGRSSDDLWSGLNSQWRRNVKKAVTSKVSLGVGGVEDIAEFYRLQRITEERNGFSLGRQLSYYQRQYEELNAERPGRMELHLARHDGEVLAAHTLVTVGRRAWYLNGASADHRRTVRPSNALQWSMIQKCRAAGATTYDMRGVRDCLDADGGDFGLLRWKLGTGGHVAENLGEWDMVLSRPLHLAFRAYRAGRR